MSSRPYIVHRVSTTEPTGSQVGDEWYNPTTNQLTKTLAVNGTAVTATQLVTIDSSGPGAAGNVLTSNGTNWVSRALSLIGQTTSNVTSLGLGALVANTLGTDNTAISVNALAANTTGSFNTAVGANALAANTIGVQNIAIGFNALDANTTGNNNVGIGVNALGANTTGTQNIAIGISALLLNTTGQNNVAIGVSALSTNVNAVQNTAIGTNALRDNTANSNIAVGHNALLVNTTGTSNTAIGVIALDANTFGNNNVAIGTDALGANTTGSNNTAIGNSAGNAITFGSNNVILGSYTGNSGGLDIRTSSNNIVLSDGSANIRMYINSSGLVGIGTVTPSSSYLLDVNGRGNFRGAQNVGTMLNATGGLGGVECLSASSANAAFMCFHKPGNYASYFGIDTDNFFAVGGWSAGAALANFKCATLSKTGGSFKIDHPLPEMKDTHHLVHSFVESPDANNIYRGVVDLVAGQATVNLDEVSRMTPGTFVALNRDTQAFVSNQSDWDAVKASVSGNVLTIKCQNNQSTASVSWLVIGERQDAYMYATDWTDDRGKVIVEPRKSPTPNSTQD